MSAPPPPHTRDVTAGDWRDASFHVLSIFFWSGFSVPKPLQRSKQGLLVFSFSGEGAGGLQYMIDAEVT